jgi:hypothetical protein
MNTQQTTPTHKLRTNKSKRTITLTMLPSNNVYKLTELSKVDFNDLQYNTTNDWLAYIRHNDLKTKS